MSEPHKSKILLLIPALILLVGLAVVGHAWWNVGNNVGYAPEQPLPFSHKLHAGDNQIPCQYCHSNADNSKHATVPPTSVCMNCHTVVKTDSPHIKKLTESYQNDKPLEWIKIHDVPDFVFFNHKRHIKKGFDCAVCHGDIAKMDRVEQVETLNMGFCVNCHRDNGAPTDCYTCHQ